MVCMKLKNLRLSEDFCGFECAVFDLDGTLLDSMPMWHGVSDKYLESHGISLRSSVWDEVKRLTETQTAVYFQEKFGIKDSIDVICAEFESIIFEEYAKKLQLKDGALDVLVWLNEMKIPCVLATATNRKCVSACLSRLKIAGLFTDVLTCLDLQTNKHEPLIFQKASEICGASFDKTVVFEDAYHCISTAKKASFLTCAVFDESANEKCPDGKTDWEHIIALSDYAIKNWREIL